MRTPFWTSRDGLVETFVGDALEVLREMPDDSVHCCVTSPPYYGLRDYGTASWAGGDEACDHIARRGGNLKDSVHTTRGGANKVEESQRVPYRETCGKCGATRIDKQIGLEKTPAEFIAALVEVFREVRRVLHPSGVAWVNMGDSYNAAGRTGHGTRQGNKQATNRASHNGTDWNRPNSGDMKEKDLLGMPWRLAFALQADGWYLRQDIIWAKPSPMPESVTDRCTKSHEYVFLLTKNPTYFYDAEAIKEKSLTGDPRRPSGSEGAWELDGRPVEQRPNGKQRKPAGWDTDKGAHGTIHRDGRAKVVEYTEVVGATKNRRSVWNIASAPYAEAHFATYPPELIRPMIRAGASEKGVCPKCLAPWVRVTEKTKLKRERPNDYVKRTGQNGTGNSCGNSVAGVEVKTKGWEPSCKCNAGEPIPATVLDCFGGSGTTGMVARQEGRRCVMIELNTKYAELHRSRVEMIATMKPDAYVPLFNE